MRERTVRQHRQRRVRAGVATVRAGPERGEDPGRTITITIGAGIASMELSAHLDTQELYRRADVALFEAKDEGRNRVVAYESLDFDPSGSGIDAAESS